MSICFDKLEKFSKLSTVPKLKKVNFKVQKKDVSDEAKVDFEMFFTTLEIFKDSLINLSLSFEDDLLNPAPTCFRMNFPKLEKLNIYHYKERLDHFLELSSLRSLTLRFSIKEKQESIVEFVGFEDWMDESNIWALMPGLRQLKTGGYCSRGRVPTMVYNCCKETQKISVMKATEI